MKNLLGISAYYHDAAACLLMNGEIVAAAQEERFTRKRHDSDFPANAINFCLKQGGLKPSDIDAVVFYDKPLLTFDRLMETYVTFAPRGFRSFLMALPVWLKQKLPMKKTIQKELVKNLGWPKPLPQILFSEHHQSHAASAFFPSPFEEAAVLCMDGVGEWATTSAWLGKERNLDALWEIQFPHSIGLLYSAFTYFTGFKVNSGEYKVMGLAPYGEPKYVQKIYEHLIDLKEDGTFRLNMEFFDYCAGLHMTNSKFDKVFDGPPREAESKLTQREMDLARSVQVVTEEIMLRLGRKLHKETGMTNLCMAGGVALNCVANGRLLKEGPFKKIWIQPAAGDAGGAVGCALAVWHQYLGQPRVVPNHGNDAMKGAYLGPDFNDEETESYLKENKIPYHSFNTQDEFLMHVAQDLANEKVVGWAHGRMEFGPRALGARSILGDPRSKKMQSIMNLKIKYRESFRPFAPAVLRERVSDYFDFNSDSPYMLMVAPVKEERRLKLTENQTKLWGIDLLNVPKSDIPAVTHVDYSARIQTVHPETNPGFYKLLKHFEKLTDCGVLVNTSFNVRGEPIVCSPEDAYRCFMRTEMDTLVLGRFVIDKTEQPAQPKDESWRKEFSLD